MTFDELCAIIDDEKLDIKADDSKDDEQLADWVCEDLKIHKEASRDSQRGGGDDVRRGMEDLRTRRRSVE